MKTALAFSPCNITGFFQIHDLSVDLLRAGSTGGGVCLSEGVTTRVKLTKKRKSTIHATFNGQRLSNQSVSAFVAEKYLGLDGSAWHVDIAHASALPMGSGYGTSGAGALSLSLALNEAMGLSLDRIEASQIAHVSEILCRTGLGTVSSVFTGGLTLRLVPGAPGIGKVIKIVLPTDQRVVTASFGPIPTRKVLKTESVKGRVNRCGKNLISRIDPNHAQSSFMAISRRFSDCLDLLSKRLAHFIGQLDSIGFRSSMAMLGESLFCIIPEKEVSPVASRIRGEGLTPIVSSVATAGAHLL